VLVMFGLRAAGTVKFAPINRDRAKKLLPVAILYNANVAFALASLAKVSVPTVGPARNFRHFGLSFLELICVL